MSDKIEAVKAEAIRKYADIIHMNWRTDIPQKEAFFAKHPPMSISNRAKIFAPFAALTGHSGRLDEEVGKLLHVRRRQMSDTDVEKLNAKLNKLCKGIEVSITYFIPDVPQDGNHNGYQCTEPILAEPAESEDWNEENGSMHDDNAVPELGYYITVDGRITYIEPAYKFLRITDSSGHTDIRFIDIWDISVETHSDENQAEHTEYE